MNSISLEKGPRLHSCKVKVVDRQPIEEKFSVDTIYDLAITPDAEGNKADVIYSVSSEDDRLPFEFYVSIQAVFAVSSKLKDEDIYRLVICNGMPLIHPVLREFVGVFTRMTYNNSFYLGQPDYKGFLDAYKNKGKEKEKPVKTKSRVQTKRVKK